MGQKLRYKLRKFLEDPFYKRGDFYVKLTFTIFCIVLYLLIFFFCDGPIYFESYKYANDYSSTPFQIHVIDVENGDAFLIRLPTNETMMVDTGDDKYYDRVESYIKQYFYYEKLDTIDYLILSHSDNDHVGNAISIMKKFKVKNIIRPILYSQYEEENNLIKEDYVVSSSLIYNDIIKFAFDNKINVKFANELEFLNLGDCQVKYFQLKSKYYSNDNNYSIIFKVTYNSKSFLFMGDAEKKIENELIGLYGEELKSDVLKVGHHGSKTSTCQEFLDIVNPQIAILSCSDNSTILPSIEVIDRLSDMKIKIASTANEGNFVMRVVGNNVEFVKAKDKPRFLVLIFVLEMFLVFIVWKNPFSKNKKKIISIKGKKLIE